jgi:UDP-N-acetylglucosamine acyltransferase
MIHQTAIVDPSARVADSANIGPYCIVSGDAEIGEGCELIAHVFVQGPIRVGVRNKFFPYSTIGVPSQDLKYHGEYAETVIGDDNTIREFVTIHRGTEGGGALTRIGNNCLVMAYAHVAHDCQVGDRVILGHGATLGGHVLVGDNSNVGAYSGVHQFCRIGRHAIVGGYSVVTQDVMPYSNTVTERTTKAFGVNKIGLERRGFSAESIAALHRAFRLLIHSKLNTSQAIEEIRAEAVTPEVEELLVFIEASERGVIK